MESLDHAACKKANAFRSYIRRHRGKEPSQSGGLDAALSQFDGGATNQEPTTSSRMTRRHGSSNRISGQSFSTTNQYTRAASPLFPSMSQFQDRGSMAMSPNMLIAPVIQPQPQEAADSLRPDKATPVTVNRMMALDGKQHLREGHGSFGTSNFYDYGSATHQVSIFERFLVLFFSLADKNPRHQNFTSISNFEGNRQKLKPISRSPPTNTGMIRASAKLASSPTSASLMRERSTGSGTLRMGSRDRQIPTPKNAIASRRKKLCNPFRQSDEDEVLAKRSHNRRRWSHVFPAGEAEFKRHSGPIWNSLTSPAILPLSIDYFPSPQELRDESMFLFSPYTVTLGGLDKKHYSTHRELLMEMVRQRITQDFQIVTDAAVAESQNRAESQRQGKCCSPFKVFRR